MPLLAPDPTVLHPITEHERVGFLRQNANIDDGDTGYLAAERGLVAR